MMTGKWLIAEMFLVFFYSEVENNMDMQSFYLF